MLETSVYTHTRGKTEIPLHVEKFHVLKSEISPHGRFLLHLHVGDRGDKYEVWVSVIVLMIRVMEQDKFTLERNFKKVFLS